MKKNVRLFWVLVLSLGFGLGISGCLPVDLENPDPTPSDSSSDGDSSSDSPTPTPDPQPTPTSPLTDTYIVGFAGTNGFDPSTARSLLEAFNQNHPSGVRTHHYRTKIAGYDLHGYICVDTETGKNRIVEMLKNHGRLMLLSVKQATEADLEQHYRLRQESL